MRISSLDLSATTAPFLGAIILGEDIKDRTFEVRYEIRDM
jgi:hypothetical protein